ncbi:class I SAM-dependent methyltransferase [Natronorubrum texcoconense]|uniref:Methyltransferase domain-containing protein n=1 Tax=Natronorubrum texcoconense TaxID=1095776 RepID=A0A1G9F5V9_9EURY|nr:class I SAM-dependent methyltransferase [Natronorubrum texcoconense]SDK83710.1 Methyltransferase domain-containing protein [Natronorubrum texcoconense]
MRDDSEAKRETASSFDVAAADYVDSDVHRQGADLERLADWCRDAETALDVATGAGHVAGAVAERGVPTVVAVDASRAMVATAEREFDGVAGAMADAERLPFAANSFDAVACRIAAHHFPDPEAFVAEVARVLRPGGTFAFEDNVAPPDPALESFLDRVERLRDPTHVRSHRTDRWYEWLEGQGFVVEETSHLTKTLEFDSWVAAQSVDADRRAELESILLDASPEATSFFEIEAEDGTVRSFANLKALVRATRVD